MKPTLTAALLALFMATASAQTIQIERVVDGDTVRIFIDGVSESLRIEGVDTPEIRNARCGERELRAGRAATEAVEARLANARTISVRIAEGRDRFGRLLGDIIVDGVPLSQWLLDAGLARVWPNGERWWCR